MAGRVSGNIKYLVLSLLLLAGSGTFLFSQTPISGVINQYANVTTIGSDFVVIDVEDQFDQFAEGDTVLLIQM